MKKNILLAMSMAVAILVAVPANAQKGHKDDNRPGAPCNERVEPKAGRPSGNRQKAAEKYAHRHDTYKPQAHKPPMHKPAPAPAPCHRHYVPARPVRHYEPAPARPVVLTSLPALLTQLAFGTLVKTLPPDCATVVIGGENFYVSGGVHFKPVFLNGVMVYKVVG